MPARLEATDPPLHTLIVTGRNTGGRVKAFTGQSGAFLDLVYAIHNSRERVGEIEREKPTDEVGERAELGNRHGDDKGKNPVHRTETPPEVLAFLAGDRGKATDLLADFDVDGLHADVEVQD